MLLLLKYFFTLYSMATTIIFFLLNVSQNRNPLSIPTHTCSGIWTCLTRCKNNENCPANELTSYWSQVTYSSYTITAACPGNHDENCSRWPFSLMYRETRLWQNKVLRFSIKFYFMTNEHMTPKNVSRVDAVLNH